LVGRHGRAASQAGDPQLPKRNVSQGRKNWMMREVFAYAAASKLRELTLGIFSSTVVLGPILVCSSVWF